MTQHAVVIVGAGPTGLTLAGELALAGVDVAVVDRRANQELEGPRASGLHSRTIEAFDQRGIAERFLSQGQRHPMVLFHRPLSIEDFPTRHNYVLGLSQRYIENTLLEWVSEFAVPIYRATEVAGFSQHDDGADVTLSDGRALSAEYIIGCDGGRSVIRKGAGIDFLGWDPTTSWLIAEVAMTEQPTWGFHEDAIGIHAIGKAEYAGRVRIVLTEPQMRLAGNPSVAELHQTLLAIYGTDFGMHDVSWVSRFTDMARQAAAYRRGRILLAGDAAHVHPPLGGQGLNLGVQDAMNLGWKLAQVVKRVSPADLLDTYHSERHPVAARVLRNTMAHVALRRRDDRSRALSDYVFQFLNMDQPRRRIVGEVSGLDVHYDLGDRHPLLGRRMPDVDLVTSNRATRVFTLLREGQPVLVNFSERTIEVGGWADRVRVIDAKCLGDWQLPVLGAVTAPSAVLIRPDGYVAWVGESNDAELTQALTFWFGQEMH